MKTYQHEFLEFAIATGVLRFGSFTLKSGRTSPYFYNAGLFNDGQSLARQGRYYAQTLLDNVTGEYMLFGPAYKGIPLVAASAMALAEHHSVNTPYAFNRKEAKDHGEGGELVGAPLQGRVVIIDDVITAGLSVRQSVDIISSAGAQPAAVVIALDRQETIADGEKSAVAVVEDQFGIPVYAIATFATLIEFLTGNPDYADQLISMQDYRNQYGA